MTAELLEASDHRTFCPFKGTATYWNVEVGDTIIENGAWTYKKALPESREIEGYVSFMPRVLTELEIDGDDLRGDPHGNISGPTVDWVMREAWLCSTPEELTAAIAKKFLEDSIAVSRITFMIWSLHPMIAGKNYRWTKTDYKVECCTPSHDIFSHPAFVNSPLLHVTKGLGGVRQSLLNEEAEFSFPIMEDLKAGGRNRLCRHAPAVFQQPDQRDDADRRPSQRLHHCQSGTCLRVCIRHQPALRGFRLARQRLDLSGKTHRRPVLGGEIRRGDGDHIDAAILFCDLRNSLRLAETMGREDYLALLNGSFETTTQIINAHDGEVLKFIGDAVLAIFPAADGREQACAQALASAREIASSFADAEDTQTECAIGLAFGDATYGNVGSQERLDFTVIGNAANIAARLSDLGKQLGHNVVASDQVAAHCGLDMDSLGRFDLHNVSTPIEAFAPKA